MKLPRRTVYCLLLALICLNILLRMPRTDHETGIDSFFIHNLATAISDQGRIAWVLNPLGYFGWYPLSYPSAGPVLISGVAQVTDIPEEGTILLLTFFYGALAVLVAFVMARAFRHDDLFALSGALVFSLAPRFLTFTLWSASTRNLFMVLIPVFVWALARSYRRPTVPNLLALFLVLVLMLATHRLTILLAVVVVAFVAAYAFITAHRVVRIRFPKLLLSTSFRRWAPRLALLSILGIAAFMLFRPEVLDEYARGEICSGASVGGRLCNLGVSITRSVGLALPFALVGVFAMVREHNKGFLEAFLVLSLLALIPTLFLRQYAGFYILPFLALFAAFGIAGLSTLFPKSRRAQTAIVGTALLLIAGSSVAVLQVEVERGTAMTSSIYTTALYFQTLPNGNFVANDGLLGVRVSSIAGRGGLPVGGAGATHQSPELLVFGMYNASNVFRNEQRIPLPELTIEDDSPFRLLGVNAQVDWAGKVMQSTVDGMNPDIVRSYRLQFYLENDGLRNAFIASGTVYCAGPNPNVKCDDTTPSNVRFPPSIAARRFRVYAGSTENLYLAFSPLS